MFMIFDSDGEIASTRRQERYRIQQIP